jgi:hypothetical protein
MRGWLIVPAMLAATVITCASTLGAAARPQGSCTAAEKAERQAALIAFQKRMAPRRKAYFAKHKRTPLRRAFVRAQRAQLKRLREAAACTVAPTAPTDAERLTRLNAYANDMKSLEALFDPALMEPADDAIATVNDDELYCAEYPDDPDCPVPASEYTAAVPTLRDASAQLKQVATKVSALTAPAMSVDDYDASAKDCGVDLTTVGAAQKSIVDTNTKWSTTVGQWADSYAAGKRVDFAAINYDPDSDSIGDEPHEALVLWAVMVTDYWNALSKSVPSAPAVPDWIRSLGGEECTRLAAVPARTGAAPA